FFKSFYKFRHGFKVRPGVGAFYFIPVPVSEGTHYPLLIFSQAYGLFICFLDFRSLVGLSGLTFLQFRLLTCSCFFLYDNFICIVCFVTAIPFYSRNMCLLIFSYKYLQKYKILRS